MIQMSDVIKDSVCVGYKHTPRARGAPKDTPLVPFTPLQSAHNKIHRQYRTRVEHCFARMKCYRVLRAWTGRSGMRHGADARVNWLDIYFKVVANIVAFNSRLHPHSLHPQIPGATVIPVSRLIHHS